jgi:acyl-CoA synthetase (AMP-forming)/AMP-acid ligase II
MGMVIHEFFKSAVDQHGERLALVDEHGSVTFNQVWDRSSRLATGLQARGIRKGERVVVLMNNRNEWIEADIGISLTGAARGRLNARDSKREWALTLDDLRSKVVIAGPEFAGQLQELLDEGKVSGFEILTLGEGGTYESAIAQAMPMETPPAVDPEDTYLIFHTSGTTGRYKGAVYPHRAWVNVYRNILALIMGGLTPDDALLHVGPLSHQSGILIGPALLKGARSVMMEKFTPDAFFEVVARERITHMILAPAIINMLANHPGAEDRDLSSLKTIFYSGAPIAPTVLRGAVKVFGPIFLQGYGSTEGGTVYNTIMYPEDHVEALAHHPERLSSCGRAVPFFEVRLMDDEGAKEVPVGEMGEIWVKGDAVSTHYWNQPEATAAAYTDGWFHMGDLATRDAEGFITIVDRKNDMIISGGLNVYPREVEDVISAHPAVHEVAVISVPDDKWGEAVTACVALVPGATLTLDELQAHCKEEGLASYKKPLRLEIVEEIPKTAVGKLFRRGLREKYWVGEARRVG